MTGLDFTRVVDAAKQTRGKLRPRVGRELESVREYRLEFHANNLRPAGLPRNDADAGIPEMERLSKELPVNLAVSLHAPTNEVRDEIVPLNRKYPVEELIAAVRRYNLIPFNEWPGAPYKRPTPERLNAFRDALVKKGFFTFVRATRGRKILAACGQLATETRRTPRSLPTIQG